jgi:sugar lactone lactonase YvrE
VIRRSAGSAAWCRRPSSTPKGDRRTTIITIGIADFPSRLELPYEWEAFAQLGDIDMTFASYSLNKTNVGAHSWPVRLRPLFAAGAGMYLLLAGVPAMAEPQAEVVARWDRLAFDISAQALAAFDREEIWRRSAIAGVETDGADGLFVTVPRWLDRRVPASLNRVMIAPGQPPRLAPWPSLEANDPDRMGALRNVLGIRRDSNGRLWVLDMGWVAGETGTSPDGAVKLVSFDPATGRELRRIALPRTIAGEGSFLNDIAIDTVRNVAFLSDSGVRGAPQNPTAIIVVDLESGVARRVLERHVSTANDQATILRASGEEVFPGNPLQVGINGIALSPDRETLFWGLTTGNGIFAAPTALLRAPGTSADELAASVRRVATPGGIDALAVDDRGRLIAAGLTAGAVLRIDPTNGATETLLVGPEIIWPDSLAKTTGGDVLVTVNHLNRVFGGTATFAQGSGTFAIWRLPRAAMTQ